MLSFVDESYTLKTHPNPKSTFGTVVIPKSNYRDFERSIFALKRRYFKVENPYDVEFKGRKLLSERAIDLPRNRELVRQVWALCRECRVTPFAVTQSGFITLASKSDYLPQLYRGIIWRLDTFLKERSENEMSPVFFDDITQKANERVAISFNNFMYRHPYGINSERVVPTAFFCNSMLTPGIQVADIVAYCVNERQTGRRGYLEELFQELREMTFNYQDQERDIQLWGIQMIPQESQMTLEEAEGGQQVE